MPRSLDPGLTIHLHRCGFKEGDAEVGALGNADARAQPALDLALVVERRRWGSAGHGPTPGPAPAVHTHHMHDACHPHHL